MKKLLLLCFVFGISYASEKDPWMNYLEGKMKGIRSKNFSDQQTINDILSSIVYGTNKDNLNLPAIEKQLKKKLEH